MKTLVVSIMWTFAFSLAACSGDVHRPGTDDAVQALQDATADPGAEVSPSPDASPNDIGPELEPLVDAATETTGTPDAVSDGTPLPDAAPTPDAQADSVPDTNAPDATEPDIVVAPGKVGAFMVVGHVGRTMMSCDDGQTWVNNRSYDTEADAHVCNDGSPVTCFSDGLLCTWWDVQNEVCTSHADATWCDCDHHPGSGTGIAFGADHFVGTWGWGPRGSLRRSMTGATFDMVAEGTSFAGMAYGQGRFIAGSRTPMFSVDGGATWQDGTPIELQAPNGSTIWNARQFAWVDVAGGRFVVTGQDGDNRDVQLSSDAGETWWRPTTLPAECASGARGIAGGNGVIVIPHNDGLVCSSSDGGDTFVTADVGASIDSDIVFDGTQFLVWSYGTRHSSADGVSWSTDATTPAPAPGPVAINPATGTIVAARGGWQNWYDQQEFYRSTDGGITWTTLPAGAFTGSHPLRKMVFGQAEASANCPAP